MKSVGLGYLFALNRSALSSFWSGEATKDDAMAASN